MRRANLLQIRRRSTLAWADDSAPDVLVFELRRDLVAARTRRRVCRMWRGSSMASVPDLRRNMRGGVPQGAYAFMVHGDRSMVRHLPRLESLTIRHAPHWNGAPSALAGTLDRSSGFRVRWRRRRPARPRLASIAVIGGHTALTPRHPLVDATAPDVPAPAARLGEALLCRHAPHDSHDLAATLRTCLADVPLAHIDSSTPGLWQRPWTDAALDRISGY